MAALQFLAVVTVVGCLADVLWLAASASDGAERLNQAASQADQGSR